MKKKQIILGAIVLAVFIAIIIWGRDKIHFDFALFRAQIAEANWWRIALAFVCIYIGYLFRAARWAWLLRHDKKVSTFSLLGSQVIGFTAIALIGRIADPVRPYLVSKKTGLPLSNQIAVYIVERLFDLGSTALIFSVAILMLAPGAVPAAHQNPGMLARFFAHFPVLLPIIEKFGGLILTFFAALFLVMIRFAGASVAAFAESFFGRFSKSFGKSVAHKILSFRAGLNVMRSFSDFAVTASLSLVMWGLITLAYLETLLAFSATSHELASMTLPKSVMLMMASGGASALQLPIIGWFTQIGIVAGVMVKGFSVATEPATACAATLLLVTFLGIVPFGLVWAQFEQVSLRKVAVESEVASEHAEEELEDAAEI